MCKIKKLILLKACLWNLILTSQERSKSGLCLCQLHEHRWSLEILESLRQIQVGYRFETQNMWSILGNYPGHFDSQIYLLLWFLFKLYLIEPFYLIQGKDALCNRYKNSVFPCHTNTYLPVVLLPARDGWRQSAPSIVGRRVDPAFPLVERRCFGRRKSLNK